MADKIVRPIYQIIAPHFTVGIVFAENIAIETGPIVKYMKGWTLKDVIDYCKKKDWEISRV